MKRTLLYAVPLAAALLFGSISCDMMGAGASEGGGSGGEPGGGAGCGMAGGGSCGKGTYWNGKQCSSKDALCGEGTKYDSSKDMCVRK